MQLSLKQIHGIISILFGLSPTVMLIFMTLFIYPDRENYQTAAEVIRVITMMPFLVALPFFIWTLHLKVKYLDL